MPSTCPPIPPFVASRKKLAPFHPWTEAGIGLPPRRVAPMPGIRFGIRVAGVCVIPRMDQPLCDEDFTRSRPPLDAKRRALTAHTHETRASGAWIPIKIPDGARTVRFRQRCVYIFLRCAANF